MRLLFETKMTDTPKSKLLQITSYIIPVYMPMFVKTHLNLHAPEGPTNMIFLRYLLLDFRQQHTNLVDHCLKPVFVKHFCSWMNPINVTLNVHSKSPAFQANTPERSRSATFWWCWHQTTCVEASTLPSDWRQTFLEFDRLSQPLLWEIYNCSSVALAAWRKSERFSQSRRKTTSWYCNQEIYLSRKLRRKWMSGWKRKSCLQMFGVS